MSARTNTAAVETAPVSSESHDLAVSQTGGAVAAQAPRRSRFSDEQIAAAKIDDTTTELPSLHDGVRPSPIGLSVEYWSPQDAGESKHCWVLGIEPREVVDMQTGEAKILECVLLIEQTPDQKILRFYNASKILVGTIREAANRGEIVMGSLLTPCAITYLGLRRCKNGNNAARWEVRPLVVAVQ